MKNPTIRWMPIVFISLFLCDNGSADWPQWRGPDRIGSAPSPPLVESLPPEGLQPLWVAEGIPGGNNGGWSSPVTRDGSVYVYTHTKTKDQNAELGEAKYPWLAPDKRTDMTDAEYGEYEVKRRDENERRSKSFRFDERLVCIDLETGKTRWDQKIPSKYTRFVQSGTPCVTDRHVLVLGADRTARCLDAKSGDVIWTKRLEGEFRDEFFASSFIVADEVALISCGPLFALDLNDGAVLWHGDTPMDYASHASPAIWKTDSSTIAIVNERGGTTAYSVSDGTKLWRLDTGTGQSSPIVAGNRLLAYGSSRKSGLQCYLLDANQPSAKPELDWRFQGAADSGSTPVVLDDSLFVQGDKRMAKVRLSDGKPIWQTTLKISNPRYTSPIASGAQVLYGWKGILSVRSEGEKFATFYEAKIDSDHRLIQVDDLRKKLRLDELAATEGGMEKSEKLWNSKAVKSGPLDCCTPSISDGLLVVRLRESVVCYDLR